MPIYTIFIIVEINEKGNEIIIAFAAGKTYNGKDYPAGNNRNGETYMKRLDIIKWVLAAIVFYTYWKGFREFQAGALEYAAGYALASGVALIAFFHRTIRRYYLNLKMKKVDRLSGRAFEKYLRAQFQHLHYRVKLTELSHDYGADLILKKRGEVIVVQAKRYESNVGIAAVQEAVGAIAYYNADRAMVVTNSGFTKSARNLARQNEVELWGRNEIRERFHIRD